LKKIREKVILNRVEQVIENVKDADDLQDILHLGKLSGYDSFYRIRIGDFRIGVEVVGEEIVFVRMLHRKDIYRYFP
jgi:mRNA interferase RelE/StbE